MTGDSLLGDERLPARFWAKVDVDPSTGCWLWTAARSHGYGTFCMTWRPTRMRQAHRHAYLTLIGDVPEGLQLDHFACDNRLCCNPLHVRPVRKTCTRANGWCPVWAGWTSEPAPKM